MAGDLKDWHTLAKGEYISVRVRGKRFDNVFYGVLYSQDTQSVVLDIGNGKKKTIYKFGSTFKREIKYV